MKWLRLQGGKAQAPRRRPPRRRGWGPAAAALGALLAGSALWRVGGPAAGPAATPPAAASAARVDPHALRLADLHGLALDEGRQYGVVLMRDELETRYEQGRRAFSDEGIASVGPGLGLSPPQEAPLLDSEPAMYAKCLRGGAWSYGALPARPEARVPCWAAGAGYPRRWVRQHWQPKRKVWSAYREVDAARAARHILRTRYTEERETELRDAASLALVQAGADHRRALLSYYGFLAEREGALAALERF